MDYNENYHGIEYSCNRGDTLLIYANPDEFYLAANDEVLNILSYDCWGRTAVFIKDLVFFEQTKKHIIIHVMPGTASYMKELAKIRPLSEHEWKAHGIYKLW